MAPSFALGIVTPVWAVMSLGHVSAYALEHRFHEMAPPARGIALQALLLWPLAVLGCWLTVRVSQRATPALALAASALPLIAIGVLASPSYHFASMLLAGSHERYLAAEIWHPWLSEGIQYSIGYLACVACAVGFSAYCGWTVERTARVRAESLADLECLRALRARINPHFLFNALNSLVGLNKSAEISLAQNLMAELSDLLRQTILASEQEEHTVAEEIDYSATYLRIQGIRHARLRSDIAVDPNCRDASIPTLILVSLVENAVSHGLRGSDAPTLVEIRGACDGASLTMMVRNTVPAAAPSDLALHPGGGLKLMGERLTVLFGTAATLHVDRPDSTHFEAILTLPLRRSGQLPAKPEMRP